MRKKDVSIVFAICLHRIPPRVLHFSAFIVPCVCVSECFRGPHLQLTQLSDKVGILAISV